MRKSREHRSNPARKEPAMGTEEITFMWKTANSWTGDCPALYKTGGGYYVQVKRVTDPAIRAHLEALGRANDSPLGADEDYGFVPADVIERVRELCPQSPRTSTRACSVHAQMLSGSKASACTGHRQPKPKLSQAS
jgi:hypothetical protein